MGYLSENLIYDILKLEILTNEEALHEKWSSLMKSKNFPLAPRWLLCFFKLHNTIIIYQQTIAYTSKSLFSFKEISYFHKRVTNRNNPIRTWSVDDQKMTSKS